MTYITYCGWEDFMDNKAYMWRYKEMFDADRC